MQLVINLEQNANKMHYYINTSSVVAGDLFHCVHKAYTQLTKHDNLNSCFVDRGGWLFTQHQGKG